MKITNNGSAPEGIRDKTGVMHWVMPKTSRDIDVATVDEKGAELRSFAKLKSNQRLGIEGVERPQQSPTIAELNAGAVFDGAKIEGMDAESTENMQSWAREREELETQLMAARSENEGLRQQLTTSVADLQTVREELTTAKSRQTELENEIEALKSNAKDGDEFVPGHLKEVTAGLYTDHKGAGKYSVFLADGAETLTGLTKVQTDEFNALQSDREKTDWVNKVAGG